MNTGIADIRFNYLFAALLLLTGLWGTKAQAANGQRDPAEAILAEGERIATLLEWDSTFIRQLKESLLLVERSPADDEVKAKVTERWLAHYRSIEKFNKSRVKLDFEESLFQWVSPILSMAGDTASAVQRIARGLPDTYFPVKILAPDLLTAEVIAELTSSYPKETLYALRFMIDPDALAEAELSAINAPYEARQYLHYANNVNTLLKASTDQRILRLMDIFKQYRYNSNAFYLLQQIYDSTYTIAEAHNRGMNREKLYNALVEIQLNPQAIGRYTADEKLSELSDKYMRKLMFQRYLPSASLELEQIGELSPDARIYFLFRSQQLLKKKDLQNLALLFLQYEQPQIESAPELPEEWIGALYARFEKESLWDDFRPFISESVWVEVEPVLPEPEVVLTAVAVAGKEAEEAPALPLFVFTPYEYHLSEDDKALIRMENNPYDLLKDLKLATGQLYSRTILMQLAEAHPVEVMGQLDAFIDQPYAKDILETIALQAPLTAKNYILKKDHPFNRFLKASADSSVATLYKIDKELGNWTRAYILLDKIDSKELSLAAADSLCKDRELLLPHLIEIFIRPEHLGRYTISKELEYAALDFIRAFNISENTDRSFREELQTLKSDVLYTYLVLGEQEIIGNTFDHMYNRLMVLEGRRLNDFFREMSYVEIDQFLRLVLHYGKEYDFFSRLSTADVESLWAIIFKDIEKNSKGDIQSAIDGAELIMALNNPAQLKKIETLIHQEYERLESEKNDEGVAAYGILASIMAQKLRDGWAMYAAPHYRIPNLMKIPVQSLFNDDLVNIQHYYFYNDRDGKLSYSNFLRQYESSQYNWKIEDMGDFTRITSTNGKSVEIYANKPERGEEGMEQLETYLNNNDLQPQILVHRGLSTHTLKTFRRVPPSAKLILDGSCGGFHIQSVALENAPGAHILCNRNIGTMHINDPMFKQISESIRQGKDIVWPNFWEDMEARLGSNPYFKDYIPPHKNVAALIIKAYYDVLDISN